MISVIKSAANTTVVFLSAVEKGGRALEHLATWAEESAGAFADQAREEREDAQAARKAARLARLAKATPALPAPSAE